MTERPIKRPMRQAMIEIEFKPIWVWVEDGLDDDDVERTIVKMSREEIVNCFDDLFVTATFRRPPKLERCDNVVTHNGLVHEDDLEPEDGRPVLPVPMPPTAEELEAEGQVRLPLEGNA